MNVYVVPEGEVTEKTVYASWVRLLNVNLTLAPRIEDVDHNKCFLEAAMGYPNYLDVISGAIENVATLKHNGSQQFDRLVIVVDSEELSYADKRAEIDNHVLEVQTRLGCSIDYRIVIQHFCFEAWALANRKLIRGNIRDASLAKYISWYNVSKHDPELLPPPRDEDLNRAQFAKKYLKLLFAAKFPKQGFSSTNPGPLTHHKYFGEVLRRHNETSHVGSFQHLLTAFS